MHLHSSWNECKHTLVGQLDALSYLGYDDSIAAALLQSLPTGLHHPNKRQLTNSRTSAEFGRTDPNPCLQSKFGIRMPANTAAALDQNTGSSKTCGYVHGQG